MEARNKGARRSNNPARYAFTKDVSQLRRARALRKEVGPGTLAGILGRDVSQALADAIGKLPVTSEDGKNKLAGSFGHEKHLQICGALADAKDGSRDGGDGGDGGPVPLPPLVQLRHPAERTSRTWRSSHNRSKQALGRTGLHE